MAYKDHAMTEFPKEGKECVLLQVVKGVLTLCACRLGGLGGLAFGGRTGGSGGLVGLLGRFGGLVGTLDVLLVTPT